MLDVVNLDKPPATPSRPVVDTYHGQAITDPYRWLESESAERADWLAGQAQYCNSVLAGLPEQASFIERCAELSALDAQISNVQVAAGEIYYLRREPTGPTHRLVRRVEGSPYESLVFDPEAALTGGRHHRAIDWYSVSPDGQAIAVAVSPDGSEDATIIAVDRDGTLLPVQVPRGFPIRLALPRYGSVSWHPDGDRFLCHQLVELGPGTEATDRYRYSCTRVCHLSGSTELVLGPGLTDGIDLEPDDMPVVTYSRDGRWQVATILHGSQRQVSLYVRAAGANQLPGRWGRIAGPADGVIAWDLEQDELVMVSQRGASNGQVVRQALPDGPTEVVLPAGDRAIEDVQVVGTNLLTREVLDGCGRLRIVGRNAGQVLDVEVPEGCSVVELAAEQRGTALVGIVGWVRPLQIFRLELDSGRLQRTGLLPPSRVDCAQLQAELLHATAADGTTVPVSVLRQRDTARDGSHPTVLTAYGFFGLSLRPSFNPCLLAWLERGGIWCVAHVRGGGERGEQWARAGHGAGKQTTFEDVLVVADFLVSSGFCSPSSLGLEGTSAGGLTAAGAMLRRPDGFAAVVLRVPVTNTLRLEMHENGPPNIPEYGSVTTEQGLQWLRISDACSRVDRSVRYPPVLATAGLRDPRVAVWHPAKLIAHLQSVDSPEPLTVLRIEEHAGHGLGSTKDQLDHEVADRLAFFWHCLNSAGPG